MDSEKLAKLLFLEEVPRAWVPPATVRSWRTTIEYRQRLLKRRVCTSRTADSARCCGAQAIEGALRRCGAAKAWPRLKTLELPEPQALLRDIMADQLQEVKLGSSKGGRPPEESGGPTSAGGFADDDPRRGHSHRRSVRGLRRRYRSLWPDSNRWERTSGLVPRQDATGNVNRLGHITKDGPATVRKMLTEAGVAGHPPQPDPRRVLSAGRS